MLAEIRAMPEEEEEDEGLCSSWLSILFKQEPCVLTKIYGPFRVWELTEKKAIIIGDHDELPESKVYFKAKAVLFVHAFWETHF